MQGIPFLLAMALALNDFGFGLYGEVAQAGPVAKSGRGALQPIETNLLQAEGEKAKRKFKAEAKFPQNTVADLGRNKRAPEQTIQLEANDNLSLTANVNDEQSLVCKLQKQVKFQGRIEDLEEKVEDERQGS